jgi:hypothetical protein
VRPSIWWAPEASVRHHLPPARVDRAYFKSFMRNQARRDAEEGRMTAGTAAYRSGGTAVRYAVAGLLVSAPRRIDLSYWASALLVCLRD